MEFNPNSIDAQLSLILERLKQQDAQRSDMHIDMVAGFKAVTERQDIANGRTSKLEHKFSLQRGIVIAITSLGSILSIAAAIYSAFHGS